MKVLLQAGTLVAAGLFSLAPVAFPAIAQAATVQAASGCDTPVIDEAHALGSATKTEAGLKELVNDGEVVRIRVLATDPPQGLKNWYLNQVNACSSWQGTGGEGTVLGNLVTIIVVPNTTHTGIAYGPDLTDQLQAASVEIKLHMQDLTSRGQVDQGIGLAETQIHQALRGGGGAEGSGSGVRVNPMVGKVFMWIGIVIGSIIVLIIVSWFIRAYRRASKKLKTERTTARQAADDALAAAVAAVGRIQDTSGTDRDVQLLAPQLAEAEAGALTHDWQEADRLAGAASTQFNELEGGPNGYNPQRRYTTEQYRTIAGAYGAAADAANQAADAVDAVTARCAELNEAIRTAPDTLATLDTLLATTRSAHEAFVGERFHGVDNGDLAAAETALGTARDLIEQQQRGLAVAQLTTARTAIEGVATRMETVRTRRSGLQSRHTALSHQAVTAGADNARAMTVLGQLADDYAAGCRAGLATSEVLGATLAGVNTDLAEATDAMSMTSQAWDRAGELLDGAAHGLATLEEQRADIQSRPQELTRIAGTAEADVRKLKRSLQTLSTNIDTRQGDQEACSQRADALTREVTALEQMLADDRPDYVAFKAHYDELVAELRDIDKASHDAHAKWARHHGSSQGYRTSPVYVNSGSGDLLNAVVLSQLLQPQPVNYGFTDTSSTIPMGGGVFSGGDNNAGGGVFS